jgi:hypothetical protein
MSDKPDKVEVYRTEDALSKATEVLAPQLGTDGVDLAEQRINIMRFTRLNPLEILPIMYFQGHTNSWIKDRMDDYMNLKMSEEGHERAKLIVDALKAIGGKMEPPKKRKDDRSWTQRNITKRGQGPDDDE